MSLEVLHPMVVHFPIALLLTAFLFETVALVFRVPALHPLSFWNLVLGTWGALAAVLTGGIATVATWHNSPQSFQVQRWHEGIGVLALTLAATVCSWRLAAGKEMPARQRWLAWGLLAVTCGVIALASHMGGRLVYEFNVVGP